MIEVTDEMIDASMRYFNNFENAKQNDRDWIAGVIKIIIELHEANKPAPKREPLNGYKLADMWKMSGESVIGFARMVEQAHGIGATSDQPQAIPTR